MMNIYFTSRRDVLTGQLIMHYIIAFGALPGKELCIIKRSPVKKIFCIMLSPLALCLAKNCVL